jgi:putative endonuclease
MTEKLKARIRRHKVNTASKFTRNYGVNKLVYFEKCENKQTALARERQLKKWNRQWKIRLIGQMNPNWKDLYLDTRQKSR